MTRHSIVKELSRLTGAFGASAAAAKLMLLRRIECEHRFSARDLLTLHDALCFLRAYPDNARLLRAAESVIMRLREWRVSSGIEADSPVLADRGFPGGVNHCEFSLPILQRMQRRLPGCFEIDWDDYEDPDALVNTLGLLVTSPECQGLDDIGIELRDWFAACRPANQGTDLEFLLGLFARAPLDGATRDRLYESCAAPIRYELTEIGTGRGEVVRPVDGIHYQRQGLDRRKRSITGAIRRPFADSRRLGASAGEQLIFVAHKTLCARNLEIRTLSYANAEDVTLLDCGRGLQVALIGVVAAYRDPLECHYCFFVFKNGVPIAYGPSTVSFGCCEIGINIFPEFRGAEVRFIYSQFMRALHQVLGARYFFLTPYGMGVDNPAAIRTGAFWFYRKLGFRPTNPEVEQLARREEERMQEEPSYRSDRATLRRLSHTSAFFDLSHGECRPLDLGAIGVRQSRFIAEMFDGNRKRALEQCISKVAKALGHPDAARLQNGPRRAWEMLAPMLAMIPDLRDWSTADKKRMLRILRAKGGRSERGVDRMMCAHATLWRGPSALLGGSGP